MILGPGLEVPVPEAGMIPTQETVMVPLNLYAQISRGLMAWIVPISHLANSGLTVNAALLLSG